MFYTYLWLRYNGTPYYVGKGTNRRAYTSWAHGVHKPTEKERIIVQECESEQDSFEIEKFFIAYYGRLDNGTGCLRNLTDGGEGPSGHISKKKGTKLPKEMKDRISKKLKSLKIIPPFQKGFHHTEETRKRISSSLKGVPKSKEHVGKVREALKGKPAKNKKTHCKRGHIFVDGSFYITHRRNELSYDRVCKICIKIRKDSA